MSIDDLQAQLRGALDQQFAALKQQYESSIEEARRQASVEAEREFAARLDTARAEFHQARTEWETQLQELVVAARADAEQCAMQALAAKQQEYEQQLQAQFQQRVEQALAAKRQEYEQQMQAQFEQRLEQAAAAARHTAELERESEKRRAQQELEAERQHAKNELEAERERAQQDREADRRLLLQERETEREQLKQLLAAERQKLQQELVAGRQRAEQELAAERQRAQQELEALAARQQSELTATRQAAASAIAAAKAAIPPPAPPQPAPPTAGLPAGAFDRLLAAITDLDAARTLSHALDALLSHAGAVAGRAALFLIDGDRLKAWKSAGIPDIDVQSVESSIGGKDLLARAIQAGHAMAASAALPAPPFARLQAGRAGLAIPVMIGGRAVAVLYADSGEKPPPAGVAEALDMFVRHASTVVALRTAMRTLDVLRGVPADTPDGHADEQSARRFAKLLVSEIKLYNEAAVRAGQQQRDLRQRLRAEIDRAQRLYEERVPPGVGARSAYFQQELVQTLADGDAALLGNS